MPDAAQGAGDGNNGQPPLLVAVRLFADLLPRPVALFPCRPRDKRPIEKGGFHAASSDPAQLERWALEYPAANVGAVPNSVECFVLDIDGPDARAAAEALGAYSEPTLTTATGRPEGGEHLWFLKPANLRGIEIGNLTLPGGITVRCANGYVLMPPSIHPTGNPYTVLHAIPPIPCPPQLAAALLIAHRANGGQVASDPASRSSRSPGDKARGKARGAPPPPRTPGMALTSSKARGASTEFSIPAGVEIEPDGFIDIDNLPVYPGDRHRQLYLYAVSLQGRGLAFSTGLALLREFVERRFPDLDDFPVEAEIRRAWHDANRFYLQTEATAKTRTQLISIDTDDIVERLNNQYAYLKYPPSVLRQPTDGSEIQVISVADMKQIEATLPRVQQGKQLVPAVDVWLRSTGRREYESMTFAPPPAAAPPGALNLFAGWQVEPDDNPRNRPNHFIQHVEEIICSGDSELFKWVMGWLAQMVQSPGKKMGTALALRSDIEGVGKSILGEAMIPILRDAYVVLAATDQLMGRFNSSLAYKILVQAEEAFWAGDRAAEGKLKDLITNDRIRVEYKGQEPFNIPNYTRLLVTSNQERIVPAGFSSRRWAVIEVPPTHAEDRPYFRRIREEVRLAYENAPPPRCSGGLLHYLQEFDLAGLNLLRPPATEGLLRQKEESATPLQAWWGSILQSGVLPGEVPVTTTEGRRGEGEGKLAERTVDGLYNDYLRYCKDHNHRYPGHSVPFGRNVRALGCLHDTGTTGSVVQRGLADGRRARCYVVESLQTCRARYERLIGHRIKWDDPQADWQAPPARPWRDV